MNGAGAPAQWAAAAAAAAGAGGGPASADWCGFAAAVTEAQEQQGRVVQVDPFKPTLKAPGTNLLTPKCDEPLSTFAFKVSLRRYSKQPQPWPGKIASSSLPLPPPPTHNLCNSPPRPPPAAPPLPTPAPPLAALRPRPPTTKTPWPSPPLPTTARRSDRPGIWRSLPHTSRQGLTLVHFSAQLSHF